MRSIIFCVLIMLFACPVVADDGLYNGLVQQGYTYQDGLWYRGNQAFVRTKQSFTYHNGHRQCLTTRYVFEAAPQQAAGQPIIEGWRKELLELKASRDKWDAALRASQEEQKEFLETVKALGLEDYYSDNGGGVGYQTAPQQGQYGNLSGSTLSYSAPLAAQGNTLYGYDQYAQSYPDVDLQVLYNQANNLAKQAQALSGDATSDFAALIYQQSQRQEDIAKIMARGRVAAQVLELLKDPERAELRIDQWKLERNEENGNWEVGPADPKEPEQPPADEGAMFKPEDRVKLFAVIQNSCVKCHGPEKKNGSLDMTKFLSFDAATKQRIVSTLIEEDEDMRMPKAAGGAPGKPLPAEQIDLFFAAAGLAREK